MASPAQTLRPARVPRLPRGWLRHLALIGVAGVVAYPFYYMVSSSLKDFFEATASPPTLIPTALHPENFAKAWGEAPWATYFANTIFIAVTVTLAELAVSVLAAYAFARMGFRGKGVLFTLFLATLMIPGEATLIPNYILLSKRYLNIVDTYQVQILPFIGNVFSIFLLRQHFLSVPSELADAAKIDGAGHLRFLWSIVLPISVPVLVTAGLISFLGSWNSFQWPLIMTNRPDIRPIQVGLNAFRQEAGASYHLLMAAATFTIAPIVALYLVAQRYLIQGVARTGIRG